MVFQKNLIALAALLVTFSSFGTTLLILGAQAGAVGA